MYGRSTYAPLPMPTVESHREENVRRLRTAVRKKRIVRRPLEIGIVQVDIGETMTCRRQVDQPPPFGDERRNPIDKHEVAQMVGAELRLKPIRRMAERGGHHSGIGDDHVESFALCQQSLGPGTHAFQVGKVECNKLKTSAPGGTVLADLGSCRLRLCQIPRCTHYLGAMPDQGPRGLPPGASRDTGHEDSFALQIYP